MNRFLKKEWQDTEIPEQVYTQARNRAWTSLQGGPGHRRVRHRVKIACSLAAMLALLLLVCVFVLKRDIPDRDQQAATRATVGPRPSLAASHASGGTPGVEVSGRTKPVPRSAHLAKNHSRDNRRAMTMRASLRENRHDLIATRDASEGMKKSEPRPLGSGPSEKSPLAYGRGSESSNTTSGTQKTEGPERIVLNFQLPTSGVRMIWILDKNFHLDGGTE